MSKFSSSLKMGEISFPCPKTPSYFKVSNLLFLPTYSIRQKTSRHRHISRIYRRLLSSARSKANITQDFSSENFLSRQGAGHPSTKVGLLPSSRIVLPLSLKIAYLLEARFMLNNYFALLECSLAVYYK